MPKYYKPKESFKIITIEEISKYINSSEGKDMKAFIAMVWLTGARVNEIVNLRKYNTIITNPEISNKGEVTITIKAQKGGGTGFPSFNFDDPFIKDLIIPIINQTPNDSRLFKLGKNSYQKKLHKINENIYGNETSNYITFHEMRHSRLTFLGRILKAMPEEIKSWTGSRTDSFSVYFAPRRVERFRGNIR